MVKLIICHMQIQRLFLLCIYMHALLQNYDTLFLFHFNSAYIDLVSDDDSFSDSYSPPFNQSHQ